MDLKTCEYSRSMKRRSDGHKWGVDFLRLKRAILRRNRDFFHNVLKILFILITRQHSKK